MKERICLITGANSGIGKETAEALALEGATIVMACRNLTKARPVQTALINTTGNENIDLLHCDLASTTSIHAFANKFKSKYSTLHVLINNAGLVSLRREETLDGFESTFGVNHLGTFLLTQLLLDLLKASAPARIINVASQAHYSGQIDFDDLQMTGDYKFMQAYQNSKLANILFSNALAARLTGTQVTSNSLHPGVVATSIWPTHKWYLSVVSSIMKLFMIDARKGAETMIYLATSPEVESISGKYFDLCKATAPLPIALMRTFKNASGVLVKACLQILKLLSSSVNSETLDRAWAGKSTL